MSLRTRLVVLFLALAVAPICALGLFNYIQTMRGLEALLARQTMTLAERAARELDGRLSVLRSDLLLLAENAETRRVLEARARGDTAVATALTAAVPYFDQLWSQYGPWYHSIELLDAAGTVAYSMGEEPSHENGAWSAARNEVLFRQPVPDGLGEVVAHSRADALLPLDVLEPAFGTRGHSLVVDREQARILYHPDVTRLQTPADSALLRTGSGELRTGRGDSARVASYVATEAAPWTVLSTASVSEFAPPFARVRSTSLLVLLLVAVAASLAFLIAVHQATRRLQALTMAADAVGGGDFSPRLPDAGRDEVGRLTAAFGLMTAKVRETMHHLERSRQMAAIGAFAAEIAHEIRNPLTSVKLNLQRIERVITQERPLSDAHRPLEIGLREIDRLERVVRGVLHLGSPRTLTRGACAVHELLTQAVDTVRARSDQSGVRIELHCTSPADRVMGDAGQLEGAFLNILLNGLDAMPAGGRLSITTALVERNGSTRLVVRIADSGPGVSAADRERLFEPFFSTRPDGTGLGLAIALRTAEDHGGTLVLEDGVDAGAVFRFEFPLMPVAVPA